MKESELIWNFWLSLQFFQTIVISMFAADQATSNRNFVLRSKQMFIETD